MGQQRTVEQIMLKISNLYGELEALKASKINENAAGITSEVFKFLHGIGDGFCEGDYYAPSRFYSDIPGVKNLRWYDKEKNVIQVKVTSPAGMLIPKTVTVEGIVYEIVFSYSSKYEEKLNY